MSDVTHAECPKCDDVQPILWSNFTQAQVWPDGKTRDFIGMEAKCRECGFIVARLGSAKTRRLA